MTQNNEREELDVRYFNEKLRLVLEGLPNYTRSELARELQRLSNTASPISQNEQQEAVDLNDLAGRQADWLKTMGWWKNKTPLESLMLVVSECGEAANEVRGKEPTEHFKTELADIILRTLGIAAENDINIQQAVMDKMAKNRELKPNTNRVK